MNAKHLLQIPIVLTLLFGSIGTNQSVSADTTPPSISITISPTLLSVNESATVTVSLSNVPAGGYTSAEFSCTYPADRLQVSSIVVTGLFGPDPATAIYDQQDGSFIVGIAGSQDYRANAGGPAFTFQVKSLGTGQAAVDCTARVSDGTNVLTGIGSAAAALTVMEPTVTPTLEPLACDKAEFIADISVPPGTEMAPGTQFRKTWRLKNVGSCTWTTSYRLAFYGGEQMGAVSSVGFPVNVAPGQMIDLSLDMIAPALAGSHHGYWIFQNDTGRPFGIGPLGNQAWLVRIVVSNATSTPTPAATTTGLPASCDRAEFIADITVPDGTVFASGISFIKTWRLRNAGSCTWTPSYQLVFFSGDSLGAPLTSNLNMNVAPGQMVDVSMYFATPIPNGQYTSSWKLRNAAGALFGVGASGNDPFSVTIVVAGPTSTVEPWNLTPTPAISTPLPVTNVAYDFVTQACTAIWSNGHGQRLPCPGLDGDTRGFVRIIDNPQLETGAYYPRLGLLTFPHIAYDGRIQGRYPPIRVQSGDRFRSIVSCEAEARDCFVQFYLDYQVGSGPVRTFAGGFIQRYDYQYYTVEVDLSPLAGQDVNFILRVDELSTSPSGDNRALWVEPIIYRTGAITTPLPSETATPPLTATPTSHADTWLTYSSSKYRFQFKYPPGAEIVPGGTEEDTRIDLPFLPATNLLDKYMEVLATDDDVFCHSPMGDISYPETSGMVYLNGYYLLKETGSFGAAGQTIEWTTYSSSRYNVCVHLNFILHSADPDLFETPPPLYDKAAESAIFEQIAATSLWLLLPPPATPTFTASVTPSPTTTAPPTPIQSPTPGGDDYGFINGQVLAGNAVKIDLFDSNNMLVSSSDATEGGRLDLTMPPGTYTLVARASGFLSARTSIDLTLTGITLPTISLLAGDIDGNDVIDQFDAMTIGMNYNTNVPEAADLNRDGIINVLDLELLARNYRRTGPVPW